MRLRRTTDGNREGRLTRFAPAVAVAVVFAAGSAVVLGHGGDTDLIHGCVTRDTTTANLIVTGAGQSCPPNTTPIHWPQEGRQVPIPSGGIGTDSQAIIDAAAPGKKVAKRVYKPLGVVFKDTKTVVENFSGVVSMKKGLVSSSGG